MRAAGDDKDKLCERPVGGQKESKNCRPLVWAPSRQFKNITVVNKLFGGGFGLEY